MQPSILALATAVPCHAFKQAYVAQKLMDILAIHSNKKEFFKRVYHHSSIEQRYSVVGDFARPREEWEFWSPQFPQTVPGMQKRNLRYKQEAPQLAEQAAKQALERWKGPRSRISHVISVSCTGAIAPGIEYYLMQNLGLSPTVNRIGINFMGCFGALKGLSVARAFALENPQARILLVCTELCSLHMQADLNEETIVANSLFSDGAAAAIIGSMPQSEESPLWEIVHTQCLGFNNAPDTMSWEASDCGFLMRLSPTVPVHIKRHVKKFAEDLLASKVDSKECDWAIHPGGASIIQAVEKALQLQPDQTQSSWKTLKDYGNMSSATFLFVLNELLSQTHVRSWTAGIGFGPGLSAEGILLRRLSTAQDVHA